MTRITADWLTAPALQAVCGMLQTAGFQAWFVGGCVRNALIGAPVSDLDIATDARPDDVLSLAATAGLRAVPTGIDHGTITVVSGGIPFEVTTFRRDVATDGRRAVIAFADDMIDDARRRDFTMNALYAGPDGVVQDPLGGLPDLAARRVRFIEDADQRIKEDYLRILRFFRFHAWYGDPEAGIDADGLAACADNIEGLQSLSRERVGQEMVKLLSAPDPAPAMASMAACGALAQVLPGADHGMLAAIIHLEQSIGFAPDPMLRLAMIGGVDAPKDLRLANAQKHCLSVYRESGSAIVTAYRHTAQIGRGVLVLHNAVQGKEITQNELDQVDHASAQVLPVSASDLMPRYEGLALGEKLREIEARWIASGFTLTKEDLID